MPGLLADLIPHGNPTVGGYIGLMIAGFVVGTIGHITKLNVLVAIGIGMVFIAVLLLPLLVNGG